MAKRLGPEYVYRNIKTGQYIYGICTERSEEKGVFFQTGIDGYSVWLPAYISESCVGDASWFVLTSIDVEKGKPKYRQIPAGKRSRDAVDELMPGWICLCYVTGVSDSCITVQLTPEKSAVVENPGMFDPSEGDLCCVKLLDSEDAPRAEFISCAAAGDIEKKKTDTVRQDDTASAGVPLSLAPEAIEIDNKTLALFAEKLGEDYEDARMNATTIISEAYNNAAKKGELISEQFSKKQKNDGPHVSVCLRRGKKTDEALPEPPVFAGLRPSKKVNGNWYVEFVGAKSSDLRKIFLSQVSVDDPAAMIGELARIALPEKWSYGEDPYAPNRILESYFYFTYYYIWSCDQLVSSENGQFRIFNTGLVNYNYSPVYCVLKKNPFVGRSGQKEWYFEGFAVSGEREIGKEITKWISNEDLPPRPNYITELSDLFFDTTKSINMDYQHMIVDNIERLPLDIYNSLPRSGYSIIEPVVTQLRSSLYRRSLYRQLQQLIEDNSEKLLRPLVRIFEEAVSNAVNRVTWNYKTAVPIFYPARFIISLLLPLELTDSSRERHTPDVALVVSRQPSGNYQGETILTLEMAYQDSRIITRPDSDWLISGNIVAGGDADYDDL